ncbi:hypothetical protein OIU74_001079 [Salix koriyanagi]|uniref:Uncharacterized protein n=1 Tax=Salix koriyanagi TaxID=2511006 RepID=A0A9Q1AMS7_9ROSI|nr:hypothetical protein OIU74_001079 [Salix koriyanagi]
MLLLCVGGMLLLNLYCFIELQMMYKGPGSYGFAFLSRIVWVSMYM